MSWAARTSAPWEERVDLGSYPELAVGKLQKNGETGAVLHNLTRAMTDIHDTLGGSLVSRCDLFI